MRPVFVGMVVLGAGCADEPRSACREPISIAFGDYPRGYWGAWQPYAPLAIGGTMSGSVRCWPEVDVSTCGMTCGPPLHFPLPFIATSQGPSIEVLSAGVVRDHTLVVRATGPVGENVLIASPDGETFGTIGFAVQPIARVVLDVQSDTDAPADLPRAMSSEADAWALVRVLGPYGEQLYDDSQRITVDGQLLTAQIYGAYLQEGERLVNVDVGDGHFELPILITNQADSLVAHDREPLGLSGNDILCFHAIRDGHAVMGLRWTFDVDATPVDALRNCAAFPSGTMGTLTARAGGQTVSVQLAAP